jgi:hypothetical protein
MYKYKKTKLNGKRIYSHRKVWTLANGEIPDGYVIHHINGDSKDNRLENLAMMTKEAHHAFHDKDRIGNPDSLVKYYKTHDVWNKGIKYGETDGYRKSNETRKRNYDQFCSDVFYIYEGSGISPRQFAIENGLCCRQIYSIIKRGRKATSLGIF